MRSTCNMEIDRIVLVVAFLAFAGISSALDCSTVPDGTYDRGCRSFTRCTEGIATVVDCPRGTVFNSNSGACDDPAHVGPPCSLNISCKSIPDGRYADTNNHCTTWYTCQDKKYLGHNFCPEGTVFDELLSTCNWEDAVTPPCGTLTGR